MFQSNSRLCGHGNCKYLFYIHPYHFIIFLSHLIYLLSVQYIIEKSNSSSPRLSSTQLTFGNGNRNFCPHSLQSHVSFPVKFIVICRVHFQNECNSVEETKTPECGRNKDSKCRRNKDSRTLLFCTSRLILVFLSCLLDSSLGI